MDREERRRLKQEWKIRHREEWRNHANYSSGGRVWAGCLLLIIGGLLLAKQVGADFPAWMFHWPMLLIAIGLLISLKSGFKNAGGLIMMVVGGAFLVNEIIPDAHMENFIWPVILIIAGIIFIIKPRSSHERKYLHKWGHFEDWNNNNPAPIPSTQEPSAEPARAYTTTPEPDAEYVEINAVFGSVNKLILSKNFKGGEVNAFMGGAEINLLQADIKQVVELEINAVFGGTKLILPGNWNLKNQITAVFGGVEDKRHGEMATPDPNKTLILKGACVFGGIEIKNF